MNKRELRQFIKEEVKKHSKNKPLEFTSLPSSPEEYINRLDYMISELLSIMREYNVKI